MPSPHFGTVQSARQVEPTLLIATVKGAAMSSLVEVPSALMTKTPFVRPAADVDIVQLIVPFVPAGESMPVTTPPSELALKVKLPASVVASVFFSSLASSLTATALVDGRPVQSILKVAAGCWFPFFPQTITSARSAVVVSR